MIWFAIILAFATAVLVGIFTRKLKKSILAGVITLIIGAILSLMIVYSGIMGG